jgi:hypothetical protein
MERLRSEARRELTEEEKQNKPKYPMEFDHLREFKAIELENRVEDLANSRLKKAMAEAGLS